MDFFLSKLLPLAVYPLGLSGILLLVAILVHKRPRLLLGLLLTVFVLLWLGGNRAVAYRLATTLENRYPTLSAPPEAEAIVILGGATEFPDPPRQMVEINSRGDRILYGARLYLAGAAEHIVLTGGRISWLGGDGISEAEAMAQVLELTAVPPEALWLESRSRNTYENAIYTRELLEEKGVDRILLVTSAFHMHRSVLLFEKQGFEVIPAPTDFYVSNPKATGTTRWNLEQRTLDIFPQAHYLTITTTIMKEYIGLWVYWFRGWL